MAKVEAGVAVLVVGPTLTGSKHRIGHCGVVERWVNDGDPTEKGCVAAGDGWRVEFDHASSLTGHYFAIFPASSLLPLDTDAEDESESTDQPIAEAA